MEEVWKDVVGREGIYSVSDTGQIKRIAKGYGARPGHILTPCKGGNGKYLKVVLGRKWGRDYVHRLVATAFLGPQPTLKHEVNHKNGDTRDNRACNLQWVTRSENMYHAYKELDRKASPQCGERQWNSKLTSEDVRSIRRLWATGDHTQRAIGERFGVQQTTVSRIVLGESWKHLL